MISKATIKLIQSLQHKKYRQKYHLFVAEGLKTVATIMAAERFELHSLYASDGLVDHGQLNKYDPIYTSKEVLSRASLLQSRSEVLALFHLPDLVLDVGSAVIYLDDVQDPGNLGAILRIADWYGLDTVIRSPASADFYSPKVVQASMGSIAGLDLLTCSLDELKLGAHRCIACDLDGSEHVGLEEGGAFCLFVGNEGNGLSDKAKALTPLTLTIGGASGRLAESLNAAMATAIACDRIRGNRC
ncbi:MAG: TrmH family RNA methyltransferase [Bacteroidota bacterium]